MSFNEVAASINLDVRHTFDHRPIVGAEIEKFRDAFERNDRSAEFDALMRKSHKVYEANETIILPLLQSTTVKSALEKMNELTNQISRLSTPQFSQEFLNKLNLIDFSQSDILKLIDQHEASGRNVDAMEMIIETLLDNSFLSI